MKKLIGTAICSYMHIILFFSVIEFQTSQLNKKEQSYREIKIERSIFQFNYSLINSSELKVLIL